MRHVGAFLVVFGLVMWIGLVAVAGYTGWNYNAEDLHGAACLQVRLDDVDDRLDAAGNTNAATALVIETHQVTLGAGAVGYVTQAWDSAYAAAPKVSLGYATANTVLTGCYAIATTTNVIVSGQATNKVDVTAVGVK